LIIAILQLLPLGLSPISPITSILPLGFVLGVTAIKEGIEDVRRHRLDTQTNKEKAVAVRDGVETDISWAGVKVGDILRVDKDQNFPCDLILLASTDPSGCCYVETKNLDGETDYKQRQALAETRVDPAKLTPGFLSGLKGTVDCEGPNNSLYTFNGYITLEGKEKISLGVRQILLRGSQLRNTKTIYGLVVYTGHDTKLMQNATEPPSKRSNLEVVMNRLIFTVFAFLGCVCLFCGIMGGFGQELSLKERPYLHLKEGANPKRQEPPVSGTMGFFTFIILFNTMIPISLYVSMELVKVAQAILMTTDNTMHNKKADDSTSHCDPHTTNLNEELGQVQYIFSDKTGTLTCNMMEFLKCSVNGVVYGSGITEIARAAAKRSGRVLPPDPPGTRKDLKPGELNFSDAKLWKDLYATPPNKPSDLRLFLQMLSVCHTVIPEVKKDGKLIYQASSPDEFALVHAARHIGFALKSRDIDSVTVLENEGRKEAKEVSRTWKILNTLEFNSTRKRMSSIVRAPDGRILLLCKGADSVIYERLKRTPQNKKLLEVTQAHLNMFAEDGLRTLCFGYAELSEKQYAEWSKVFHAASTLLVGREEAVDAAAEQIERDLTLVGASAIEDKLQEGVPRTIEVLARAGIKIWVLTGDKQETAINIGFACSLLHTAMHIVIVNDKDKEGVLRKLVAGIAEAKAKSEQNIDIGFVIDGSALAYALEGECEAKMLELALFCKSVICCRVSPIQKALVVRLVKDNLDKITLAVGDGANDVSMIQAAHLGIGIEGEEGTQAVRSSDYSVGQFRFLAPLLLVHGRWSYQRISILILYSFYKNMAFSLTQFWFATQSLFTGQTLFESFFIALYNVFFTSLPIMMIAVFDQDVSARAVLGFPLLYKPGQEKKSFNIGLFWLWLGTGVWHSVVFFFVTYFIFRGEGPLNSAGHSGGLWMLGTFTYTGIVITVNLKIALHTSYWTFYNHFFTWGSIALWFVFVSIYANFVKLLPDAYSIAFHLYGSPPYWIGIVLIPVICLLPDYTAKFIIRNWFTMPVHVVKEIELYGNLDKAVKDYYDEIEPQVVMQEQPAAKKASGKTNLNFSSNADDDDYTYITESYYTYTYSDSSSGSSSSSSGSSYSS
jgi:phospholipid-transporting ATPase